LTQSFQETKKKKENVKDTIAILSFIERDVKMIRTINKRKQAKGEDGRRRRR